MNDLTIVTGLFDLGRGDLEAFHRSFDHYKDNFAKTLDACENFPMVIFCEQSLEEFIWQYRKPENTKLVFKTLDDLRDFPFFDQVDKIRNNPEWLGQAGWLADSTQAKLPLYNPLVMSKQFFLNDAAIWNFFDSNYFLWLDGGLTNTVSQLKEYLSDHFEKRILKHMNRMLYVCFPYDGQTEVHGFAKHEMNRLAKTDTAYVARGGIFGGPKHLIHEINDIYYGLLSESLNAGYMGTEESIFTIITYRHKDKCNIKMIENNGLVYKFFEDLRKNPITANTNDAKLAIYALTYNLPQQFKFWVESFQKAFPLHFSNTKKYVINNSTDPNVKGEYDKLFTEYGFQEFKFHNIGINDARAYAATHFDSTGHEYMIFFEDDMLLCDDSFTSVCKSGFNRWVPNLFDKCMNIMEFQELDFLKLSFTEFFGENDKNWAWENIHDEPRKSKHFPKRHDNVDPSKARVDYLGYYAALPFAVGEFHYCNWPLMFNKEGNRKMFLETVFEHKFEQTWMGFAQDLMRDKKLKVATLLATPINHNRRYDYGGENRRENKHYSN